MSSDLFILVRLALTEVKLAAFNKIFDFFQHFWSEQPLHSTGETHHKNVLTFLRFNENTSLHSLTVLDT